MSKTYIEGRLELRVVLEDIEEKHGQVILVARPRVNRHGRPDARYRVSCDQTASQTPPQYLDTRIQKTNVKGKYPNRAARRVL